MTWLLEFLGSSRYSPFASCLSSDPVVTNLMAGADFIMGLSFYLIGLGLWLIYSQKARVIQAALTILTDPILLKMLALTLVLDGLTHHVALITLFSGIYYLQVILKAAASGFAFFMAVRMMVVSVRVRNDAITQKLAGEVPPYAPQLLNLPAPDAERLRKRREGANDGGTQQLSA